MRGWGSLTPTSGVASILVALLLGLESTLMTRATSLTRPPRLLSVATAIVVVLRRVGDILGGRHQMIVQLLRLDLTLLLLLVRTRGPGSGGLADPAVVSYTMLRLTRSIIVARLAELAVVAVVPRAALRRRPALLVGSTLIGVNVAATAGGVLLAGLGEEG